MFRGFARSINRVVATAVVLLASMGAQANLVTNGGFETGDFTGWVALNLTLSGVQCLGAGFVPQGNCDGFFGPVGSDGTLEQALTTVPGQFYNTSFDFKADGGVPSDFSVSWGAQTLYSVTNPPAGSFTVFDFSAQATSSNTTLAFNFRNDPGFLLLDAVTVSVPEPATLALLGLGLAGLVVSRRRKQ